MRLFGVMGDARVERSLSPRMHNAVLAAQGIAGVYAAFPVQPAELAIALQGLRALGAAGVNVTVPHKEAVAHLVQELADEAKAVGAVNTLVPVAAGWRGHNTDVAGFLAALDQAGCDPRGETCLVMGAGGAARAVVYGLISAGAAAVAVAARDRAARGRLCGDLGGEPLDLDAAAEAAGRAGLIVNATSVSDPGEGPALAERVAAWSPGSGLGLVADLNYGRAQNLWADLAARAGAGFRDGLTMLAHQAAASFTLWTGRKVLVEDFMAALEE